MDVDTRRVIPLLTRILHNSPSLCNFISQLDLKVSAPQLRHITNVAEIQRQFVSYVDPSNVADTFRIAPWTADDIHKPLASFLIQTALERMERLGQPRRLLVNLDDSLAIKDPATHCLQGVD